MSWIQAFMFCAGSSLLTVAELYLLYLQPELHRFTETHFRIVLCCSNYLSPAASVCVQQVRGEFQLISFVTKRQKSRKSLFQIHVPYNINPLYFSLLKCHCLLYFCFFCLFFFSQSPALDVVSTHFFSNLKLIFAYTHRTYSGHKCRH